MRLIFSTLLFFIFTNLFSYQWPSAKSEINYIFGSYRSDQFLDGVEFRDGSHPVYPMADGEVIYYSQGFSFGDTRYENSDDNTLVIEHKGNFSAIYRNFSTNKDYSDSEFISQSDLLGISDSEDSPFVFSVYDEVKMEYINPQLILPRVEDDNKPVINGVKLVGNGTSYELTRNKVVPTGYYKLYIDTYDVMKIDNRLRKVTPFQIYVFVDGFKNFTISFSSFKEVDEKIYLSGDEDIPLDNIMEDGYYFGGEHYLTRGKSQIEIVIEDIYGNETSRSIPIRIGEI